MAFLDEAGLKALWNKIKEYVTQKSSSELAWTAYSDNPISTVAVKNVAASNWNEMLIIVRTTDSAGYVLADSIVVPNPYGLCSDNGYSPTCPLRLKFKYIYGESTEIYIDIYKNSSALALKASGYFYYEIYYR